jgi:hypothetical protein
MSESDLTTAFEQLASSLQSTLMQAQSDSSQGASQEPPPPQGIPGGHRHHGGMAGMDGLDADSGSSISSASSTSSTSSSDSTLAGAMQNFLQDLSALTGGAGTAPSTTGGDAAVSTAASSTSSSSMTQVAQNVLQDIQDALTSYQSATASLEKAMTAGAGVSLSA